MDRLADWAQKLFSIPFSAMERAYWGYLLSAAVIAGLVYLHRTRGRERSLRGLREFVLPRAVYTHPSAWLDIRFMLVNVLVKFACLTPIVLSGPLITGCVTRLLTAAAGQAQHHFVANPWVLAGYTVLITLLFDFALYLGHFLQHKIPGLWEFHKVHHSAQVLHPGTAYRMHPVDDMLNTALAVLLTGVVGGVFAYWFGRPLQVYQFWQVNIIILVFYLLGYNLRHSHVWLSYGPLWSKLVMSPAQHQIHHSNNPKHFDRNMGFIFSLWDWLFDTLHIPEADEEESLSFGLKSDEDHGYASITELYFTPFRRLWASRRHFLRP